MEHIEEAGIHSGDSACVLPPITLGADQVAAVEATARLGRALGVIGVLNVQFAFKGERLYVLEANPRASRSVPFVEKVTGLPVAKAAALLMTGSTLAGLGLQAAGPVHVGVKEAVLPFARFPGADSLLGPEMRSTGEVLGLDARFGAAFAKSQEAAYGALPLKGVAFLSVRNADKRAIVLPAKRLADLGFTLVATTGTAGVLRRNGVEADVVRKGHEGPDNVVDRIGPGRSTWSSTPPPGRGPGRTATTSASPPWPPTSPASPPCPASPPSSRESRPAWPATWPSAPSRPGMRTADDPGPGARRGAGAAPGGEYHSLIWPPRASPTGPGPGSSSTCRSPRTAPCRYGGRSPSATWSGPGPWRSSSRWSGPGPGSWLGCAPPGGRHPGAAGAAVRAARGARVLPAGRRRLRRRPAVLPGHRLRARRCRTHFVLEGGHRRPPLDAIEAERLGHSLTVTTDDGSAGHHRGLVTDPLGELLTTTGAERVYACGPMPMLAAVSRLCAGAGVPCQVAVEEQMACGTGICFSCVVPVGGGSGGSEPGGRGVRL